MNFSLNEMHALAKKATRGAGYPWGLAEEAAMATCWLCARDLDGSSSLARLLEQVDKSEVSARSLCADADVWHGGSDALCPITSGAAVSDQALSLTEHEIRLGATSEPMMLLPFVAQAAQLLDAVVSISWPGFSAATDGTRVATEGTAGRHAEHVVVRAGGNVGNPNSTKARVEPSLTTVETLQRFAQRTYAPATEESRLKGAGAGLSDNN